jgi:2-alkyl-3-oxoalkanoate reductase
MKIFLAGATGVIGRRLVPLLVERGHEVVGTTRSEAKGADLRAAGATPVELDLLDERNVLDAVTEARPEVVVHQATALKGLSDLRRFNEQFAETNRLRTEGTEYLLAAAVEAGSRRFVAQSYAGWPSGRKSGAVKSESDPLDPAPAETMRQTHEAIRHLETVVLTERGLEGIVLRYGGFYGPGTSLAEGGAHLEAVQERKFPIVGSGAGVWSFVHIDDAASATLAAIERGAPGLYNIVDDVPAPVSEWLPALAAAVGAKPPRHVPLWLGRRLAGEAVAVMMTEVRGASNAKAKRELGWVPRYASWRAGFATLAPAGRRAA